jgi:hypothetical protein
MQLSGRASSPVKDSLTFFVVLLVSIFSWKCGRDPIDTPQRSLMTLKELAVTVRDGPRSFFLSDKRGGFLVGSVGRAGSNGPSWSINGKPVVVGFAVNTDECPLGKETFDSAQVLPDRIVLYYNGDIQVQMAPLESTPAAGWGLAVSITASKQSNFAIRVIPSPQFERLADTGGRPAWRSKGRQEILTAYAGELATVSDDAFEVDQTDSLTLILIVGNSVPEDVLLSALHEGVPESFQRRADRMGALLNRGYLRTSDDLLTRTVAWSKLSLDALLVIREDTLAVASIPWDGSFDGRANLQALPGFALVSGEYETAASILRTWANSQDDHRARRTYGWIARRLHASPPVYDGVDVSGWFVRGIYDYVVATNDTVQTLKFYPVIWRTIEGLRRRIADKDNFLRHAAGETWMSPERFGMSAGPYAAVEVQSLWQFQQEIGAFIAQLAGDTITAKSWAWGSLKTSRRFMQAFIDTGRGIVYDYLDRKNNGVDIVRPNGLLALDGIEGERNQRTLIERTVKRLLYVSGPGTLDQREKGFRAGLEGAPPTNGAIATWLTGPFVYAVSRYDRADLALAVVHNLATRAMEDGMVGALPAYLPVASGVNLTRQEKREDASLTGMSEFVRCVYQDFLGIRVDAPSSVIWCEPKLPPEIHDAEFTVFMGSHSVQGSYHRGNDHARMSLSLSDVPRPVRWRFIWMLDNGDAWLGSITVRPNTAVTLIVAERGVMAYEGEREVGLDEQWAISRLSRKNEALSLQLADLPH